MWSGGWRGVGAGVEWGLVWSEGWCGVGAGVECGVGAGVE